MRFCGTVYCHIPGTALLGFCRKAHAGTVQELSAPLGAAVIAWSLYRPRERSGLVWGVYTWVLHAAALTVAAYMRRLSATCVTTRAQYFRRA
jgi:hypothetical protein